MSDLFKTQMQETGRASTLGMTLAEVVEDVVALGINAHRVVLSGSQAVLLGFRVRDPSRAANSQSEAE